MIIGMLACNCCLFCRNVSFDSCIPNALCSFVNVFVCKYVEKRRFRLYRLLQCIVVECLGYVSYE